MHQTAYEKTAAEGCSAGVNIPRVGTPCADQHEQAEFRKKGLKNGGPRQHNEFD